jgi:gas vesicle protein
MDFRDDSTISFLCGLAAGVALGTLGMFIFDPKEGRRRRALARDKAVHYGREASDFATGTAKDLRNRAYGVAAETRSAVRETLGSETPEAGKQPF